MKSRNVRLLRTLLFLLLYFLAPALALGGDWKFGGHAKYQFTNRHYSRESIAALSGADSPIDHGLDLRANSNWTGQRWEFEADGEFLAIGGDSDYDSNSPLTSITGTGARRFPSDDEQLFDLSKDAGSGSEGEAVVRADRLYVGYTSEKFVVRVGRQAISWGNGLAFSALDIFNPFSPLEIDKDYKPGVDLLYLEQLYENGSDLSFLAIPRRDFSGDVSDSESSYAFRHRGANAESKLGYELVVGRHFEASVLGAGVNGEVFEAIWRADVAGTRLPDGETVVTGLFNIDRSWIWCGKNWYGFIEYFRNGFGENGTAIGAIDSDLAERLARGELYTLGTDYLAAGLRLEVTPLLNAHVTSLENLHDESGVTQLRLVFDMREDADLTAGFTVPYGSRGTEFGGLEVPGVGTLEPGKAIFVRLGFYF